MKINMPQHFGADEELEEFFDPKTMPKLLSPSAAPFHPTYEPVNIAIYNDGVPSLTLPSEEDRFEILHGIQDDAIDERFPLDASDAAEMELMEAFVTEMANLSVLEEREERARLTMNHIKKRWEARRRAGPSGRPRPPMHLIVPVEHNSPKLSECEKMVSYAHANRILHEDKLRSKEIKTSRRVEPRHSKTTSLNNRRPIQQPRKDQ